MNEQLPVFDMARAADLARAGRHADAEAVYRRLVEAAPSAVEMRWRLAETLWRQAKWTDAEAELRRLLERAPLNGNALLMLGVVLEQMGRSSEAEQAYREAAAAAPNNDDIWVALASLLRKKGDLAAVAETYRSALPIHPDSYPVNYNAANVFRELGRYEEAERAYRRAIEIRPAEGDARYNLAVTLRTLGRTSDAIAAYRELLQVDPDHARAWNNLGICLRSLNRQSEAVAAFREAIRSNPKYADAHYNLGNALGDLDLLRDAGIAYRGCLQINPRHHLACFEAGNLLLRLAKPVEAEKAFRRAVSIAPENVRYREELAGCLKLLKRFEEASAEAEQILARDPDNAEALHLICDVKETLCDWSGLAEQIARSDAATVRQIAAGTRTALPSFRALARPMTEAQQLAVARTWAEETERRTVPKRAALGFTFQPGPRERLKIGYISQDFRNQAMGNLTRSMYGLHDRKKVEIFGYSVRVNDNSVYRRDIERGCDHFLDVVGWPAADVAKRIHADGIDILVDLMGYTEGNRMVIMALRPAPIQVGYLRFPGTSGAPFIDYMLCDPVVTPPSSEPHYTEKLVRLPHCYQVNDFEQKVPDIAVSRADEGLPEDAFVFCCFNNSYKIEASMFDVWMRILKAVPGSVLWILRIHDAMTANLRREAASRGVDPDRLVFSNKVAKHKHLARHVLADLFLDTRYYTAHTTASDALLAGVPIVTVPGQTFASRVTASILKAIGLEELILPTLDAYEQVVIGLANDPVRMAALKAKVIANRPVTPLFDTARWVRNVERAYRGMWDNYAAGNPPRSFDVVEN